MSLCHIDRETGDISYGKTYSYFLGSTFLGFHKVQHRKGTTMDNIGNRKMNLTMQVSFHEHHNATTTQQPRYCLHNSKLLYIRLTLEAVIGA